MSDTEKDDTGGIARGSASATMPDPLAMLVEEHGKVGVLLDGLVAMAQAAEVGAFSDSGKIRDILWFLREYTDGRHHAKEEELLFPVLEMRGLPREAGPTQAMRLEHVQGRKLVALIEALIGGDGSERGPDWKEIAWASLAYVRLLRAHIQKENHCIFGIAEEILGPTEKDSLGAAFLRIDREWAEMHGPAGAHRVESVLRACHLYLDTLWSRPG